MMATTPQTTKSTRNSELATAPAKARLKPIIAPPKPMAAAWFLCTFTNNHSSWGVTKAYTTLNTNNRGAEIDKLLKRNAVLQQRIISLISKTALERYNEFLKTYPGIVQRVPQKMIASYLGITPQALSKTISQASGKR